MLINFTVIKITDIRRKNKIGSRNVRVVILGNNNMTMCNLIRLRARVPV